MRIVSLEVEYPDSGWKLEKMTFDNLNLLVGVSGVGKTRILQALMDLNELVSGAWVGRSSVLYSPPPMNWTLELSLIGGTKCVWTGIWDGKDIVEERLINDGAEVIGRNDHQWRLKGHVVPKGNIAGSLVRVYANIDYPEVLFTAKILGAIRLLMGNGRSKENLLEDTFPLSRLDFALGKADSNVLSPKSSMIIDGIFFPLRLALFKSYSSKNLRKLGFEEIESSFKDIFPQVSSISLSKEPAGYSNDSRKEELFRINLFLYEDGFKTDLPFERWSSGMQIVFTLLAKLKFSEPGQIFLIDEFENSLGVNCIHAVMDSIMQAKNDHQFIITSHHPYIINNVPFKHWKIITRKGAVVTSHDAAEFKLGQSKHQAFIQLTNLPEFTQGIVHA